MSGVERHREAVDVHLILRRDGEAGPEVLLSRRAGEVYAAGMWHLPSGHLDGPHEDVVRALIREAREETGVVVDPAEVRFAVVVHHRGPGGRSRTGFFFEVRDWRGTPAVREPAVCDAMGWYGLDALPEPMVAYCRAGLDTYRDGHPMAVHFQHPDDPIAHALGPGLGTAPDRRRPVPAADTSASRTGHWDEHPAGDPVPHPNGHPEATPAGGPTAQTSGTPEPTPLVMAFTQQAVGRVTAWTDVSWAGRDGNRVWRVHGADGGTWFVKVHRGSRFHLRETAAFRSWVPGLGAAAPRLVAADASLRAVVITAVPGRSLHGAVHTPAQQRRIFRHIGRLAAAIHRSAPPGPAAPVPLGKWERHLTEARPHLAPGDEELVRSAAARAAELPALGTVPTHGDLQLRNLRWDESSATLHVIDFERAEHGPAVRDFVRLSDAWLGRQDLYGALTAGYGRPLTAVEEAHLTALSVLDALSGIQYGAAHGDPELVERGRRTLARHRTTTPHP